MAEDHAKVRFEGRDNHGNSKYSAEHPEDLQTRSLKMNAFKAGWAAALGHAPEVRELCKERDELKAEVERLKAELDGWKMVEQATGRTRNQIYGDCYKLKAGKYGKPPIPAIPSCDCNEPENKKIHDDLCDVLEANAYNEADVCTASVGIWATLKMCGPWRLERDALKAKLAVAREALATQRACGNCGGCRDMAAKALEQIGE